MTIKKLKEIIKDLPDHMDVFIGERSTEFAYGLVNSVRVDQIDFYDSECSEIPLSHDTVFILEES